MWNTMEDDKDMFVSFDRTDIRYPQPICLTNPGRKRSKTSQENYVSSTITDEILIKCGTSEIPLWKSILQSGEVLMNLKILVIVPPFFFCKDGNEYTDNVRTFFWHLNCIPFSISCQHCLHYGLAMNRQRTISKPKLSHFTYNHI